MVVRGIVAGAARRIFTRRGRARDTASYGAAGLGLLLLAGAALGTGVARTAVDVSDGLTWLPDNPRGEALQVNPGTGRPETRLQVAGGDAQLDITQKDGLLVILDSNLTDLEAIALSNEPWMIYNLVLAQFGYVPALTPADRLAPLDVSPRTHDDWPLHPSD